MLSRTVSRSLRLPASRLYSTAQAPPLLLKLRTDLKDAMRNKDTNRLNVIRGILSDIDNASKKTNPPSTDLGILSLINKTKAKSAVSITEFREAGRQDLAEKEEGQAAILDTYASMVERLGKEEIKSIVDGVINASREISVGIITKKTLAELAGRPVVKSDVAEVVKEVIESRYIF